MNACEGKESGAGSSRLCAEKLRRGHGFLARQVVVKETTESTNDDARELAEKGAASGTVALAETQTRGRGRLSRSWHSPPGRNLYFSVILRPSLPGEERGLLTLAAGLAVARAVRRFCPGKALVKWPNDVRAEGKKLAGILAESADAGKAIILGIGLNVNMDDEDWPAELRELAVSLKQITGREWPREEVFAAVMEELELVINQLEAGRHREVLSAWMDFSEVKGRRVKAALPRREIVGTAVGVKENGALLIEDEQGLRHEILAGDVELV